MRRPRFEFAIALTLGVALLSAPYWLSISSSRASQDLQEADKETSAREVWDNSKLWGQPTPGPAYEAKRVYAGVDLKQPLGLALAPGSNRIFVCERRGRIYSFVDSESARNGAPIQPDLCFNARDISPETREVYGLAFDPDFETNRHLYVCYITKSNAPEGTQVSRFTMLEGEPPRVDLESEVKLLSFQAGGHNGGCLRFGPDGYLYISSGDSGPASPPDPLKTGQDNRDLLSCILRIDVSPVSETTTYAIPPDNPLIDAQGSRPEIFAYGLRNPWKMSFDEKTGDLWVGDVGWELWEMIYRVVPGGNYGWSVTEGFQAIHPDDPKGPTPILPPTVVHSHLDSRSITGGYVYYGERMPELQGHYVYGDYETGKVWSFRFVDGQVVDASELADTPIKLVAFGKATNGELLLVDLQSGLYELVPTTSSRFNEQFPQKLSQTGLFADTKSLTPAKGVHAYKLRAEPWQDGAISQRHLAIPSHQKVRAQGQGYVFPEGTTLSKTISFPVASSDEGSRLDASHQTARRLETQVLINDAGVWQGYSYVWNSDQTDATLVGDDGITIDLSADEFAAELNPMNLETWRVPSRTECMLCHTTFKPEMGILGFEPHQIGVAEGKGADDEQHQRFVSAGVLPSDLPKVNPLVSPLDEHAGLEQRARSYLHVNCRHCHRDGGGGGSTMKLEYHLPIKDLDLVDWIPQHGDFGIEAPFRVSAGKPGASTLLLRMAKLGRGRMPYNGSERVDRHGISVVSRWIDSLDGEPESGAFGSELSSASKLPESVEQALQAAVSAHATELDDEQKNWWRQFANANSDPTVRDLIDGVLPEGRRDVLGRDFDREQILGTAGNPATGRELFYSTSTQCSKCHRVGGLGGDIGPDLSAIADQNDKRQLLLSIVEPSEKISQGYQTSLIELSDGEIVTGRVVSSTPREVTVGLATGSTRVILQSDIEAIQDSTRSIMPDDLPTSLSPEELRDLLAFLESLRTK